MAVVQVRLDREGSQPEIIDLDLNLDKLTLRESVRLEEALGPERFSKLALNGFKGDVSPSIIRAVLYAKLKTVRPDVTLEDFDVDYDDLEGIGETEEVVASPLDEGSNG